MNKSKVIEAVNFILDKLLNNCKYLKYFGKDFFKIIFIMK